MSRTAAVTLALSLATAAAAQVVTPPAPFPPPGRPRAEPREPPKVPADRKRPDVRTLSGDVAALGWDRGQFTIDSADGPVVIQVDRNTMVFLDSRLGTLRDVAVGLPVRASVTQPGNVAAWVEVRQRSEPETAAASDPGRGSAGSDRAPGASPTDTDAGASPRGNGGNEGGGAGSPGGSRSPPSPSPIPPPSPQAPGSPPGPGPVPGGRGTDR